MNDNGKTLILNDERSIHDIPILQLNKGAEPVRWINYKRFSYYESKGKILYTLGTYEILLRGGTNAVTGKRSTMTMDTIVAIDNDKSPYSYCNPVPALTNKTLFERDLNMCAYCGNKFRIKDLTRDHVHPKSRGGPDIWTNVVASCRLCNSRKDNMTPSEAGMPLLFVPYVPNRNEHLLLRGKNILADQMEFLMRGVHKDSRLRMAYQ